MTGAGKDVRAGACPKSARPTCVVPYADRMELAYAAADLVVCRSGANTVCELTAVGLPAVYVPLPIGNGEQRFNAADVLAAGGGLLVEDAAFTPEWITDNVVPLAGDGERLLAMGSAAASVGQRDADDALADMVHRAVRLASGSSRGRCWRRRRLAMTLPQTRFDFPAEVPRPRTSGRVHFVAIGGAGMSGVARILLAMGWRCRQRSPVDVDAPARAARARAPSVHVGLTTPPWRRRRHRRHLLGHP